MLLRAWILLSASVAVAWGQQDCFNFRDAAIWHIHPLFTSLGPTYMNTLNYSSMPDDIHGARKATLTLRDLLDVFSPVFPNTSKTGDDLWGELRTFMDDGYTLLGDFQDLAHSGVNYTQVIRRSFQAKHTQAILKPHTPDLLHIEMPGVRRISTCVVGKCSSGTRSGWRPTRAQTLPTT